MWRASKVAPFFLFDAQDLLLATAENLDFFQPIFLLNVRSRRFAKPLRVHVFPENRPELWGCRFAGMEFVLYRPQVGGETDTETLPLYSRFI